mgnify:CR=1 FL=1
MRKIFLLAALVVPLALIGCSDSSDDGVSTNYTGTASKASLSTGSNAQDLGAATVTGMTLAQDPFDYEFMPGFLYYLDDYVFDRGKKLNTISESASISVSGGCGGTAEGSMSMKSMWDDETKEYGDYLTLTITFTDYSDWGDCYEYMLPSTSGAIVNGTYSVYHKINEDMSSFTGSRKYVLNNMTFFYPEDWGYPTRVAPAPYPISMTHSDTGDLINYSGMIYANANGENESSYFVKSTIDLSYSEKIIVAGETPDTLETQDIYSVLWAGLTLTEDYPAYEGLKVSGKVCVDGVGCATVGNNEFEGSIYDLDYTYYYQPWEGSVILSGEGMDMLEVALTSGDEVSCPFELYYSDDAGTTWSYVDIFYGYPVDLEWEYCE